jgi:hypothetical protein
VAVCLAGGEREVSISSYAMRMARKLDGNPIEISQFTVERQCENEFLKDLAEPISKVEAVVSFGCGAGVQPNAIYKQCGSCKYSVIGADAKFCGQFRSLFKQLRAIPYALPSELLKSMHVLFNLRRKGEPWQNWKSCAREKPRILVCANTGTSLASDAVCLTLEEIPTEKILKKREALGSAAILVRATS